MNDTSLRPWRPLRDLRAWAAVSGCWVGILLAMYASGAFRYLVDGELQGVLSTAVLEQLLRTVAVCTVGTMVALHCAPRLAERSGARFGWAAAALVAALSLVHVIASGAAGWPPAPDAVLAGTLASAITWSAVLAIAVVLHQWRVDAVRRSELQAAQLRALRAQLQPHFLFNTLHAIGAVAPRDGATAARMTALLGDLLRQTLRERGEGLVSLAEEQELLRPYLALQQLRFADRLRVELDVPPDVLGAALPDLVLQPLVENALQHGIEARPGAGHVRVVGRRDGDALVVEVHDDGSGLSVPADRLALGTGLGATKARLHAIYGDRASLALRANEHGGTTATLRLPWREVRHAA